MIPSDDASVASMSSQIRSGSVSPVQIAERCLQRIRDTDPSISAWVHVDPALVLREAERLETERSAGRWRGPLHGIPVGIKDIIDVKGLPTAMGASIFENHFPDRDAEVVGRLRQAGAVVLGKTVTTQFATLDPAATRNPWNTAHSPGGSSSGSAAAVAAGMCPLATGTQTVGSLGRPAAYCGVVALMPTASRVSARGVFPVAWSLDHVGGFGRSAEDVRILSETMCGVPFPIAPDPPPSRIGIVEGFFCEETDPAAWDRHEEFLKNLRRAGRPLARLDLPASLPSGLAALWTIMRAEVAAVHEGLYSEHADTYRPALRQLIESGALIPARDYLRALRIRKVFQRQMLELFQDCEVILSPGATGTAPVGLESTGNPILSAPWTLADFPTLSLPLCLGGGGMPLGIQLTAPPMEEARLFALARSLEPIIGFPSSGTLE